MNQAKEKPASGGNHLAGLNTQNTQVSLTVLDVLDRIAKALETSNAVAVMQNKNLNDICNALYHLKEA